MSADKTTPVVVEIIAPAGDRVQKIWGHQDRLTATFWFEAGLPIPAGHGISIREPFPGEAGFAGLPEKHQPKGGRYA